MSYIALRMYDVYLKSNLEDLEKPKTIKQYNPHKAFILFNQKSFLTGDCAKFEELFPKYVFYGENKLLHSLISCVEENLERIQSDEYKSYKTYCKRFLKFLRLVIEPKTKSQEDVLNKLIKAYQIDGVSDLVDVLGGIEKFLQKALENSYFFAPDLVASRFFQIEESYKCNGSIPARWKGKRKSKIKKQKGYAYCDIDTNGNSKVQQIIKEFTGYTVSIGRGSVFTNYRISHIWGEAQDPRYFTNLWNIVLVPAWVNDLLDKKTAVKGSFASKVLNTYKAICLKYYKIESLPLGNIGMSSIPSIGCQDDIVEGDYNFKSIKSKDNTSFGQISTASCCL